MYDFDSYLNKCSRIQKLRPTTHTHRLTSGKPQTSSGRALRLAWHGWNTGRDLLGFVARKPHAAAVGTVLEGAEGISWLLTRGTLETSHRVFAG